MSEYYSWRWIFWFKLPLILLAIVLSWFTLADLSARRPASHRLSGSAADGRGDRVLLLALAWGGRQHAWDSPVILLFSASVVLGALFLAWQKRASEPLLPISILRNRIIVVTSIGAILITMVNMALSIYLPLYLQLCRAKTVGQAGVLLTAPLFGVVLGAYLSGQYMRFTGRYKLSPLVGLAVATAAFLVLCGGGGHACPGCRRWPFLPAGRGHRREPPPPMMGIAELGAGGRYRHRHRRAHLFRAVGGAIGVAVFSAVVLHMLGPVGQPARDGACGAGHGAHAAQEAVHAFSARRVRPTLALAWR